MDKQAHAEKTRMTPNRGRETIYSTLGNDYGDVVVFKMNSIGVGVVLNERSRSKHGAVLA
jgi:hypothetical protein